MGVIKTDGTENLRATPTVKTSSTVNASPSGSGKDMGGTENLRADHQNKGPTDRPQPSTYAKDSRPKGVDHFDDDLGRKNEPKAGRMSQE